MEVNEEMVCEEMLSIFRKLSISGKARLIEHGNRVLKAENDEGNGGGGTGDGKIDSENERKS